jgi:nickel/cobalt exporter
VRHASKHFSGFGEIVRKAPYFSGAVIYLIGLSIAWQGVHALMHQG